MNEHPFAERNLPTYPAPTVMLYQEQLQRFRQDYDTLLRFCALAVDKPVESVCLLDLETWLYREKNIVTPFVQELLEQAARADSDI